MVKITLMSVLLLSNCWKTSPKTNPEMSRPQRRSNLILSFSEPHHRGDKVFFFVLLFGQACDWELGKTLTVLYEIHSHELQGHFRRREDSIGLCQFGILLRRGHRAAIFWHSWLYVSFTLPPFITTFGHAPSIVGKETFNSSVACLGTASKQATGRGYMLISPCVLGWNSTILQPNYSCIES